MRRMLLGTELSLDDINEWKKMIGRSQLGDLQDVSHATDSADQLLIMLAVKFVSEIFDVNIHNVRARLRRHVPYLLRQHRPGECLARILEHDLQQRKLSGSEIDISSIPLNTALAESSLRSASAKPAPAPSVPAAKKA
jgi:hypothetical protein